ncbi:TPA: fructose-specific PTS transporter subunit EIIC [Streptococcus agalactiae]|jgi:PTS system D-fructose-specific IIA component (F6P-forming), Fru family (TC 4.A.2.1.7)/PTS system D-fructose-specific IIB component (F6P-forming), Fru family (TC 4.A.2.1.7)/PTS system D-fructose-specific IIC component (F6P-forming), Fru family (TC 4.A.2.1.7)|uniref:PTS system, fructose specific IIABC components n=2 Tax=Streptococcus agalactiae TaxID=1311 RepID=Q8DYX6_STRA5|nr:MULTISPECIES: fructose-specific PTS transporter subunit EIIC [Streptococcus]EPX06130.1 PTS fructose transporter subunit IIC [Streptococcus agalactiae MRI Z1-049]HEO8208365.1 PTS sugar transporter subunit IIA [Streptococcus agalactiae ADL-350]AAN00217.1 PTS system, fructose specific IIABC components [Streptococcus agalactiae 2603V/R]AKU03897.1 PTS fructose transporter subunit IIC [Streptococcus agalactiae]APS25314.1 PTS fructose transporter subunit IIC [Streptococcus agalactiae]
MKIQDLLKKEVMIMDLKATSKEAAIDEMITKLVDTGVVTNFAIFKDGIMKREAQTSTGLGDGIAMPHSKNAAVKEATVLFAKSASGVDYEALDGQPTDLFFMIAAPDGANDTHLAALAELSKYLLKEGFADQLRQAKTPDDIIATFDSNSISQETVAPQTVQSTSKGSDYIVAVTACTTGIAHTYMAEEALKKKAAEMGVGIKVETNGASGVGNKLTSSDIARAKGVIIAADKAVEMDRFDGKPLVSRPVADGIKKSEDLINIILDNKAQTYHAKNQNDKQSGESDGKSGLGSAFYKHLMGGVSQMLPFVIGGGIMIAIAFLFDNILGVPKDQLSNLGSYHEIAALFKNIGGAAFAFMLPVLAGYIAYSIAEKPGLVAGFVAGSIASSGLAFGKVPFAEGGKATLALAGVPSGFLGALVGGFLAGGVILLLRKLLSGLPKSLEGIKSILLYPLLGVLITGFLMLLVNIPMAAINTALNTFLQGLSGSSAVLMGLLVGGMMAVDMGGPVNKAAYVFGTGTLAATVANGGSVVMAAVMAGGMVPPLAVFVATLLFKDKFNNEERQSGLTNIVMGLSFITEGAIPFGAADPARAIPSFIVGSALTGALVGLAGIKLMAPHGGIFVIALTSNPLLYILFILIGAVVSGVLFGLFRKIK